MFYYNGLEVGILGGFNYSVEAQGSKEVTGRLNETPALSHPVLVTRLRFWNVLVSLPFETTCCACINYNPSTSVWTVPNHPLFPSDYVQDPYLITLFHRVGQGGDKE